MNNFSKNGFSIIDVFSKKEHQSIIETITKTVNKRLNLLSKVNFQVSDLKDYHDLTLAEDIHKKVVDGSSRFIDLNNFNASIKKNNLLTQIMDECWGHHEFRLIWVGDLNKNAIQENYATFRLARPNLSHDVVGIHCDKHVGGIKNMGEKNTLTIWVPIVGFDEKYTLNLSPGSHQYTHPDNSIEADDNYLSRTFDEDYISKFKFYRPNLNVGQGVIFDPNLLHGKSYNLGIDTRVSIELRLFNAKKKYVFDS